MTKSFENTAEFRNASFRHIDLSGSVFRGCDVNDVKIVGCDVNNLRVDGHLGRAGRVIVDGIDVTDYVAAELDRQFPELARLEQLTTADDFRTLWGTTKRVWDETIERARRLPQTALNKRVDGEWSFVETLRHLVFATDVWIGRMIRNVELPFASIGLPSFEYSDADARAIGIDLSASPPLDDVIAVHLDRRAQMDAELAGLDDARMDESRTFAPEPVVGVESATIRDCLFTVIEEHLLHRRYAVRDLKVLETG
ncbi:MAG TPA: DinB family protein [Actinomycetes bacterium]|nr:DinB family protein [Actinomycetes bacterium]